MAVETIHTQTSREAHFRPNLDHPEIIDALKHGNIYEVLRTAGVNRHDIEEYLAGQARIFQNQILQDYEVYASAGALPPPSLETNFAMHNADMKFSQEDRHFFHKEGTQALGQVYLGSEGPEEKGPGQDVKGIAEKTKMEWDDFFGQLQEKVMNAQMFSELESKSKELKNEIQRIIALVMSGQADPEYVIIAATKANMLPNGVFFRRTGEKIFHMNARMDKISQDLLKQDVNNPNYMKESQYAQSKIRSSSTDMQMEMMNIQKFAGNIATTLEWANNAIRNMHEMRRTTTQNISAR